MIEHHPDKFALGSKEREEAEEFTKRINEARDVLLNRSWTPEFDPRRDPRPYANNPYAHPRRTLTAARARAAIPSRAGRSVRPLAKARGRPPRMDVVGRAALRRFRRGQPAVRPFRPVRALPRNGRAAQDPAGSSRRSQARPRREGLVIAGKVALLAVAALAGTAATGLFLYVMISIVYGLWKRFGSCLIGLIVPLMLLGAPFVFIIAPRQGRHRGLAVAFLLAVLFDVVNVRNLLRALRVARRATSSGASVAGPPRPLQRAPSCYTESFRHGSLEGVAG
ncbi:MAG: J domain-containing protein [Eggerthellaceae bacterium]